MNKYILLEGLPGAGKSTLLKKLKESHDYSMIPDFANPATLVHDFLMDWQWVLEIECQKSKLAARTKNKVVLQERGYLSVLACHYMLERLRIELTYETIKDSLVNLVKKKEFIIPDLTVIIETSIENSQLRQPGTRLNIWKDKEKIELINQYYHDYITSPLFGEKIMVVETDNCFDSILLELN